MWEEAKKIIKVPSAVSHQFYTAEMVKSTNLKGGGKPGQIQVATTGVIVPDFQALVR